MDDSAFLHHCHCRGYCFFMFKGTDAIENWVIRHRHTMRFRTYIYVFTHTQTLVVKNKLFLVSILVFETYFLFEFGFFMKNLNLEKRHKL